MRSLSHVVVQVTLMRDDWGFVLQKKACMPKYVAKKNQAGLVDCLDEGIAANDQLKTNAVQTMKAKGVTKFQTV